MQQQKQQKKHGNYKGDWKNYESGSDATYMGSGSEYEMKTSIIPLRSQCRDHSIFDDPASFV